MEAEALRAIVAENRQLEQNLTKRNEQYIFDLKKSLKAANLSEEELALALHGILPELVAGQKTGKTARQLFGTVSERTEAILNKPAEVKEPAGWMIWLDNTWFINNHVSGDVSIFKRNRTTSRINHIYLRCDGWGLCFLSNAQICLPF